MCCTSVAVVAAATLTRVRFLWIWCLSDCRYTNLTRPALTVPIFGPSVMHGSPGVVVNVTLPPMQQLSTYQHIELDMALSCPGTVDETCAIWDHTVQLFVCCDGQVGGAAVVSHCHRRR